MTDLIESVYVVDPVIEVARDEYVVEVFRGEKGDRGIDGVSGDGTTGIYESLAPSVTVWNLQRSPTRPANSMLFVNGQKQRYAIDYQINGVVVTWLGYPLASDFSIEIYYI